MAHPLLYNNFFIPPLMAILTHIDPLLKRVNDTVLVCVGRGMDYLVDNDLKRL